jgi:hypothetical protein
MIRIATRSTAAASLLTVGLLLMAVAAAPRAAMANDEEKDWQLLGEAKVEARGETDEIKVGSGVFKRIKLQVKGADVEFKKLTVVYENGDPEQVDLRDKIKRGGETRAINLKGRNRAVKKVILAYKADKGADRDAHVILLGSSK